MVWEFIKSAWGPAVEVMILAVVIYFPLMYVRGTRGWPIVLGFLAILLALSVTSVLLNLQVLTWLLRYFYTGFAFAVLVIFQPELRRIFAELGKMPLFVSAQEERENIEVIVQSAGRLSEMRIGALLALQRTTQLDDYVESGIVVDCEATPEMLEAIFFPNNAIHDGGVIIKGDRIARAACIFPLTKRPDLSKSLGTRHRAALGLSEETDAVVVIVSEETGSISYAYQGELVRGLSIEELRAFLTGIFVSPRRTPPVSRLFPGRRIASAATRGWLASATTFNRPWKLTSLLLAVLVWTSVHSVVDTPPHPEPGVPTKQRSFLQLPITVMTAAEDSRGFFVEPSAVGVIVHGPETAVDQLLATDLQVFVDLVDVKEARGLRKKIVVHAPPGIRLVQVDPAEVEVQRAEPTTPPLFKP